ncbi:hypothetical protein N7501_007675 [Penicillium viridicatum]|nr:hypothetical protein N7501_007675 [Penicillium viridicatum]
MSSKSSKLAKSRREQAEKRREDEAAKSRRREEERRDEFADFLARGFKRAFDLDRRRSASLRGPKLPPITAAPPPSRIPVSGSLIIPHGTPISSRRDDSRAADLGRRGLPANTHSGPSRRGLDTSRWNPNPQVPQEEASHKARSGSKSSTNTKGPSKSLSPDNDVEMAPLHNIPAGATAGLVVSGAVAVKTKKQNKIDTTTDRLYCALGLPVSIFSLTIIDAELAKSLGLPLQRCIPVPVAGIGSRHLSSTFVRFDAFFRGVDNTACIQIEAHLVENLKAKLLIGMDIMGYEGFRLDFDSKTIKIPSCMGIEIPIAIHAKPHHAAQRAVYAAESTILPPRSIVRVPARVDRIGTLYEADIPMACAVKPEAAEPSRLPTDTDDADQPGLHQHQIRQLTDVLMHYDVWGEHPGVAHIPENRWMTTPLKPVWESRLPKTKIYPVGPKDRAVIDGIK